MIEPHPGLQKGQYMKRSSFIARICIALTLSSTSMAQVSPLEAKKQQAAAAQRAADAAAKQRAEAQRSAQRAAAAAAEPSTAGAVCSGDSGMTLASP